MSSSVRAIAIHPDQPHSLHHTTIPLAEPTTGEVEISFAYDKVIPLVGNASLLLEFEGTTAAGGVPDNTADR